MEENWGYPPMDWKPPFGNILAMDMTHGRIPSLLDVSVQNIPAHISNCM